MKFSDVKNRTCLYLLGGIAGMEGPLLNIIQTRNGKLFFEFYNRERLRGEELMKTKTKDGFPIETKLPICIWQETTMEKLEKLLSKESLEQNEYEGPFLNEFMQLEGNPIYLEKKTDEEYIETSWTNKYIQSRMEDWVYAWKRTRLLDGLNWNFDYKPKDKTILQLVLEDMARTED